MSSPMPGRPLRFMTLAAGLVLGLLLHLGGGPVAAAGLTAVTLPPHDGEPPVTAWLMRPDGTGPFPAIVLLHGCGGLWRPGRDVLASRHRDWAERFASAGYVVLLPDSFRSRGVETVCHDRTRSVPTSRRVGDVRAAADWLGSQTFVQKARIGLMGWSHGGATVLRALSSARAPDTVDFNRAVAFYPSCTDYDRAGWRPRVPLLMLHGEADLWTSAPDCKALAAHKGIEIVLYPDAHHGFDTPNQPLRQIDGAAYSVKGDGVVKIGTNPAARADAINRVMRYFKQM